MIRKINLNYLKLVEGKEKQERVLLKLAIERYKYEKKGRLKEWIKEVVRHKNWIKFGNNLDKGLWKDLMSRKLIDKWKKEGRFKNIK